MFISLNYLASVSFVLLMELVNVALLHWDPTIFILAFYFLLCDALHIAEYTHMYHSRQCPVLYFLHYLCVNNQTSIFLYLSFLWSIFEKNNEQKYVLHYVNESR
jgi:hypothetical protein